MPYSHFLRQALPKEGSLDLSPWLMGCKANDVYYDCNDHRVMRRTHFSDGDMCVMGHYGELVPHSIHTLGELLDYIQTEMHLARLAEPNTLRLFWPAQEREILLPAFEVSVGRESRLSFPDAPWNRYLSRHHGSFSCQDGTWYLSDYKSTNGTWVNGEKLSPYAGVRLAPGDVIRFGARSDNLIFNPPKKPDKGRDFL